MGDSLYKIFVIPKENTKFHFKGHLFFTRDSLNMKYKVGSIGKCVLPLKELKMRHKITMINDVPVTTVNKTDARLFFPVIYPDRWLKTETYVSEIELIKNK